MVEKKHKELNNYELIKQLKRNVVKDSGARSEIKKIKNSVKRMQTKTKNS